MNQSNAFSRSKSMFAAIATIIAMGMPAMAQQQKLASLGEYTSRGKGGKRSSRSVGTAAFRRAAVKAKNKARNRRAHRG